MKRFVLKRAFGGGGNSVNPSGVEVLGCYGHSEGDGHFMPEESHKRENFINNAIFRGLEFAPRSQNFVHVAPQQCTQSVRYPDSFYSVRPQIRFAQDDEAKHVIESDSETIQSMDNQKPLQEIKYTPTSKSKISVLPQGVDMRSNSLAPCGRGQGEGLKVAFTEPSEGMSGAKVEQTSAETLSFRCVCERCRLTRGEGATHVANSNNSRKVAFTLAETLITLGIIGVVAALTIPVLISGYKKHIVEVKLERFYSNMNQAILLSEIDNGNLEEWPVKFKDYMDSSYTFWEVYLSKYFKSVKSVKKGIVSTSVILIDGSSFNIGTGDCVDIYYFLNSNDMNKVKSSLVSGKDYFSFRICANSTGYYSGGKKGFFSASNGSLEQRNDRAFLLEHCQHPFEAGDGDTCTALIQYDGWKIKGDYPIKF